MLSEPLDFEDLAPVEVPVNIGKRKYILVEASGEVELKRRNHIFKFSTRGDKGNLVPKEGFADWEPIMISLCLYRADRDGNLPVTKDGMPDPKELVPVEEVKRWRNKLLMKVYEKLQQISGMGPDTPEELEALIKDAQERLKELRNGAGPKAEPASSAGG